MKIRTGFVSNSSTASFIIEKKDLTEFQTEIVRNFEEIFTGLAEANMIYGHVGDWYYTELKDCFEFEGEDTTNLSEIFRSAGIKATIAYRTG
jgi:hypothetical protein